MSLYSAAKSPAVLNDIPQILRFAERCGDDAETSLETDDGLRSIFSTRTAKLIRGIQSSIPRTGSAVDYEPIHSPAIARSLTDDTHAIDPTYAFLMSALFLTIRKLCGVKPSANPTWIKQHTSQLSVPKQTLVEAYRRHVSAMLNDIKKYYSSDDYAADFFALNTDVKAMPIERESVDAIITSPPYLTRIDYAMSTVVEMMFLTDAKTLEKVRHATMGSPVITKNGRYQHPSWGPACNALLDGIKSHNTKAAATYYWKNIVQYFMDAELSLKEIWRVLRPNGEALVVVQTSYFKELEVELGKIYVEMAESLGFAASVEFTETITNHMAHVNTASNRYKKGKVFYEHVVHLRKP